MKNTFSAGWQASLASLSSFLAALVALAAPATRALAADSTSAPSSSGTAQTVYLEYRETPQSLLFWGFAVNAEPKAFQKEPDLGGRKVSRGSFQIGPGSPATGFIWDYRQARLYLDLNHDRDLTDDPDGVFTAPVQRSSYYYQTFTNIHLKVKTPAGEYPLCADLNIYNPEAAQPAMNLSARSFWQGKISLQDRDWEIGIIDRDSSSLGAGDRGYLLLRSWDQRTQFFDLQSGSLAAFAYAPNLFFGKQAYRVDCSFVQQDGAPKYKLTFREKDAELGELRLAGKFIERLVLSPTPRDPAGRSLKQNQEKPESAAFTVVLDRPDPVARIPIGHYGDCQVLLKSGNVSAHKDVRYGTAQTAVDVVAGGTNSPVLLAGGPLTNSVEAQRQGSFLSLNYQLLGADGARYQLTSQNRAEPPRFVVYKKGKQIHSGRFEFG